jgi:Holliday junction resolvasome RuvABC endonuclease subunit
MKILALDPATRFGWAISKNIYGVWNLKPQRDESSGMMLIRLRAKISEIHEKENIDVMVFERPGGRNFRAIANQSKLQGVIEEYCEINKIEYKGYSSSEIKKFATGKGNANKEMMIKAAHDKLGYMGNDDNEADALWILELAKVELNVL